MGQGRCVSMCCWKGRCSIAQHAQHSSAEHASNRTPYDRSTLPQHCHVVTFPPTNNELGACRSPIAGALVRYRHPWENHFQGVADADPRPGADRGGLRGKHCLLRTACTVLHVLYCLQCCRLPYSMLPACLPRVPPLSLAAACPLACVPPLSCISPSAWLICLQVGRLGIGICYDIRFPEMAALYAARGVQLIVYPGERGLAGWVLVGWMGDWANGWAGRQAGRH